MAAVPFLFQGVLGGKDVTLQGVAYYTDLGVGGGPMPPAGPVDPGYGIPENPNRPAHPIYNPIGPSHPIAGPPDRIWGPTDPRPENPIVIPPPPPEPEVPPGAPPSSVVKDPDPGQWGYYLDENSVAYSAYRPQEGEGSPKKR